MEQAEWDLFLSCLNVAEGELRAAGLLMDGIEGFAPGAEDAWTAALASIDAIRAAETYHRETRSVAR